ncbi:MAG TPA: hypothetical protein VG733_11855 [Chthoniobacteraceae bacterium]|nr:hypothetical protein [Chthoniobacteraceae bacterium]
MRAAYLYFVAAAITVLATGGIAHAKRGEPAKVEPVVYEGVRYSAPNDDNLRGYLVAVDVATGKKLYEIDVYKTMVMDGLEADVQWVFIKNLEIKGDKLIVTDEKDRQYSVDLKTRTVRKIMRPIVRPPA